MVPPMAKHFATFSETVTSDALHTRMKSEHFARVILAVGLLVCLGSLAHATCVPIIGLGSVQMFDNNGKVLPNGAINVYQAGTTTQVNTFVDSACTIPNTNPVTMTSGGRATIWLQSGQFYKFVFCLQNDGAFCAAGDVLFSVDNVPGASGGGGGGGSSPFTGTFISGSANPATSGVLELASGDSVCWRNVANSANLCISKDTNDLLTWAGGSFKLPEISCPTSPTTFDLLCADSTAHRLKMSANGGSPVQLVAAGVDVNTSDQVTQWHFGSTVTPLSGTAPTTSQFLQWNGTNIIGSTVLTQEVSFGVSKINPVNNDTGICGGSFWTGECAETILVNAHTLVRFVFQVGASSSGCTTLLVVGVRDITASTTLTSQAITNGSAAAFVDSGALNISMPAGHTFGVGMTTAPNGCSGQATVYNAVMVYQ